MISTRIESSAARIVAPRRRPEIRPTSPKIEPRGMRTPLPFGRQTSTEPEAIANSDDPGSSFSNTVSPMR